MNNSNIGNFPDGKFNKANDSSKNLYNKSLHNGYGEFKGIITPLWYRSNTIGISMPITKWNCQITKVEEIPGAIAKAYNIQASKITTRTDLKDALLKMLNYEGSYLLEVLVTKEENVFSMLLSGASVSEIRLK